MEVISEITEEELIESIIKSESDRLELLLEMDDEFFMPYHTIAMVLNRLDRAIKLEYPYKLTAAYETVASGSVPYSSSSKKVTDTLDK